ncbi:MAG: ATP-binding protein [Pseudomonadota bacterium]
MSGNSEAETIQRLKSRLEIITYFSQSIYRQNTIEGVLWDIVSNCIERLGFVDCVIYLLDKNRNVLVQKAAYGSKNFNNETVIDPIEIPLGQGIVGSVAQSGKAEIIADTREDSRYILDDNFRLSELAVPIVCEGKVIGVIDSEHPDVGFYDSFHLDVISDIALISATKIERKWNEEERQNLLFMHLENPNPIVRISRGHKILLQNDSARIVFDKFVRSEFSAQRDTLFEVVDSTLETGQRKLLTLEFKDAAFRAEVVPFPRREYVNIYFVDVSEIFDAKVMAERANRQKTDFLSMMSHEIRTPLNGIINLNRLLKDQLDDEEQQKYLEAVEYSGNNLLSIINDILDFEKLGAGKLTFSEANFQLSGSLEKVINLLQPKADEKNIKIGFRLVEPIADFYRADENRLSQVVTNIVNNALKFTDSGAVGIAVREMVADDDSRTLEFEITDTGIGIPAERLQVIFESFEQIAHHERASGEGTGLGLSIAKRIVDQLGGSISVDSTVGVGSTFTVVYPVKPGRGDDRESNNDQGESGRMINRTILVVDDSPINILAAREYLQVWGARVLSASNGEEALAQLANQPVDLVLMDLQMPRMDGYGAVAEIRKMDGVCKSVPVIAMSADVLNTPSESLQDVGFNDQLTKPFDPVELQNLICSYLSD